MSGAPGTLSGRVPDFFIAGHPKCGTTALHLMLRSHPEIFMPDLKEPQFFAPEMRVGARALPDTLEAYMALFAAAGPEQRAGEASPSYLRSRTAAGEIAAVQPNARIIAIFREPASFLRSVHLQFVQAMIETEHDLGKAILLERSRREGRNLPRQSHWTQALMYSEHVRYVEQIQRFRDVLPQEQMLVLIYDDIRNDNEAAAREILRFLEVDDSLPIKMIEANPTVRVRAQHLHGLTRAVHLAQGPAARTVKSTVNAIIPRQMRRDAFRPIRRRVRRQVLFGEPDPPDEALMLELRRRFKGEVQGLSDYLGRDLVSLWGYDEID